MPRMGCCCSSCLACKVVPCANIHKSTMLAVTLLSPRGKVVTTGDQGGAKAAR